ncbi:MAG TPA: hypothetical protein VLE51_03800 [Candidatus Saccharimonadales bacterium]|nr:hypothetical protein [Candidatus Saccharimonadales bacterium]
MSKELDLSDMFGTRFPSTKERLNRAYLDPVVHERSLEIMMAPAAERPALQAQLSTFLAAAHMLFAEESEVILKSLDGKRQDG